MPALPAALTRVAAVQHALVTTAQCRRLGIAASTTGVWVRRGWLEWVQPHVLRVAGSPETFEQQLLGAVLGAGPGAAASHRAAAFLWGLVEEAPAEVVVPYRRNPRLRDVAVHRSRDGIAAVHRQGIPVTSPMRALVDLAAVEAEAVEDALDRGLAARLFTVASVESELAGLGRPGRTGGGRLRVVLQRRALGAAVPDGLLEPRFARLLRRHRLPAAVFQHPVRWRGRDFRIDFAYPAQRIAVEVDGYEKRSTPEAFQHDTERQTALATLGWTVLRFTWADVVDRPAYVASTLFTVLVERHPPAAVAAP
ncbi:MAG TPA: DUF559 domain-containing protein [Acidimicrobiales bacterium]|nr:DUF559 domain-containing protein [Acidimicrobiales bacterium]